MASSRSARKRAIPSGSPMRILYVTAHYPPDFVSGATLQVRRLAEAVAAEGHDVAVLSGAINAPDLPDGAVRTEQTGEVAVHWLGTAARIDQDIDGNWQNPHATRLAAELLDAFRPDVVHGHALQTLGADVFALAADRAIPTVVTMHDFWWWCSRLFLVDRDLRPCDGLRPDGRCACARDDQWRRDRRDALQPLADAIELVLVPSQAMARTIAEAGVALRRLEVDENDVDVELPDVEPAPAAAGDVRFLYVGGDSPLKGKDVLLAAVAELSSVAGWRADLRGVTPAHRSRWRRGDRRVRYLPAYRPTETGTVLADADVLVIPSIARESFSIAAREALHAGLAVITSDCLGPEEVVVHDVNGLVVPTGDPAALAAAMRRLIEDHETLVRLRRHAAAPPVRVRTPSDHARALLARYEALRERAPD